MRHRHTTYLSLTAVPASLPSAAPGYPHPTRRCRRTASKGDGVEGVGVGGAGRTEATDEVPDIEPHY